MKEERLGKECEVKLGRKWTKIQAKIVSDDSVKEFLIELKSLLAVSHKFLFHFIPFSEHKLNCT